MSRLNLPARCGASNRARRASEEAAKRLNTLGMKVTVLMDDRTVIETTVRILPWQLGHGAWVVGLNGITGGYACERVSPALKV